jgi:ketosteroid isomerase-like protein
MPWFPDFVGAVELARSQTRAAGQADPVAQYLTALSEGDPSSLETAWPGQVVIHDPRGGEVRGHRHLRHFIRGNESWLATLQARTEMVAATTVGSRAVVELLAHLDEDGREMAWPVAVVAESPDDRSVVFRTYCSQWPLYGHHEIRPPVLRPASADPGDVCGRYHAALAAGDTDAIVSTYEPDGYFRDASGPAYERRGADELRSLYATLFSAGGGFDLQHCAVTDDGVRCVLEYNFVRWGSHELPPQAGLGVYERGPDGLLAAARVYDDVQSPVAPEGSPARA